MRRSRAAAQGAYRRRLAQGAEGAEGVVTRPTGDRVREAAFSLIGPIEGAAVLDLFAGSGAMGLEALSRGASRCVFVERDRAACRVIQANLEKLHHWRDRPQPGRRLDAA